MKGEPEGEGFTYFLVYDFRTIYVEVIKPESQSYKGHVSMETFINARQCLLRMSIVC